VAGDLATDTAVRAVDEAAGRYEADISQAWEIWGPMGGYVAGVALRAAGAASPFARPASFSCHYLGVAAFGPVDIAVAPLRAGRQAASHRVSITQGERSIMEALVWSIADTDGLVHDESPPHGVVGPEELPSIEDLVDPDEQPPFPFWLNFEARPLDFVRPWPPDGPLPAVWREWLRFVSWDGADAAADPWLAAARLVLLADLPSWPSGSRPHAWKQPAMIAPTLDLQVSLLDLVPAEDWLLVEGTTPVADDGLMAFTSRLYSTAGRLVATGGGQCLCRPVPG
jgi:acyl-CoA thioesterase-2